MDETASDADGVEPEHDCGYMPKEEFVWADDHGDIVSFYLDRQDPETGEVTAEHICTLEVIGERDDGTKVLGNISANDRSLQYQRPVNPGYTRRDEVPYRVDPNYIPDDYEPDTRECPHCGKDINMEAGRSSRSAISNGKCPHCYNPVKKTAGGLSTPRGHRG